MATRTVLIVGAGPAGTRAAERLVTAGMRPVVVDEGAANGGQIYRRQPAGFRRKPADLYGFEAEKAQAVHGAFEALGERIDYRPNTLVWHLWENEAYLLTGTRTERLAYDALILADRGHRPDHAGAGLDAARGLRPRRVADRVKAQACAIGSNVGVHGQRAAY
jgi:NADPH-dependent 2,4-dienoyl-CoA reductase/sulfur reductase-like enzyme